MTFWPNTKNWDDCGCEAVLPYMCMGSSGASDVDTNVSILVENPIKECPFHPWLKPNLPGSSMSEGANISFTVPELQENDRRGNSWS